MTEADRTGVLSSLPTPPDINIRSTVAGLRRVGSALRLATPGEELETGPVERVLRRSAVGATDRLDAIAVLLDAGALVEVALVARLLFELEVSTGYIVVSAIETERGERAERFEAWSSYTMSKALVGTASTFPIAPLAEHYPAFAGVLHQQSLEDAQEEMERLLRRFPGMKGARTWSTKSLKNMADDVAAGWGRPSGYSLLYPMLSLFSHPSAWSISQPETSEARWLATLSLWLFPYFSALAALAIWQYAWPGLPPPLKRSDFDGFWTPEHSNSGSNP